MIHQVVKELSSRFLNSWSSVFSKDPLLMWDESYPALGILDLILASGRGASREEFVFRQILSGVSATVACYIHDTLSSLGRSIEVNVGGRGVELVGQFHPNSSGSTFLFLEERLSDIISRQPEGLPIFRNFERIATQYGNWLTPLTLGVLMGSSGMFEESDIDINPDQLEEHEEKVLKELARQSAAWYERVYPDEPLGQVAELYLSGLIFPPMYMKESFPCLEAIKGIEEFRKTFQVSQDNLNKLLSNLLHSPDEVASAASLAYLVAASDRDASKEMFATARRFGAFLGILRGSVVEARKHLGLGDDWITRQEPFDPSTQQMIRREIKLGFIPWLKLPLERVFESPTNVMIAHSVQAMADFDMQRAKVAVDKVCEESPSDIDFRVQQINLIFLDGDSDSAMDAVRQLLSEPEAESQASVFLFMGMLHLLKRDALNAAETFQRARSLAGNDRAMMFEAANNYAWALMCQDKYEDALDVIELTVGLSEDDLVPRLNRIACLHRLGKLEDAENEKRALTNLSPFHPRVFYANCFEVVKGLSRQEELAGSKLKH